MLEPGSGVPQVAGPASESLAAAVSVSSCGLRRGETVATTARILALAQGLAEPPQACEKSCGRLSSSSSSSSTAATWWSAPRTGAGSEASAIEDWLAQEELQDEDDAEFRESCREYPIPTDGDQDGEQHDYWALRHDWKGALTKRTAMLWGKGGAARLVDQQVVGEQQTRSDYQIEHCRFRHLGIPGAMLSAEQPGVPGCLLCEGGQSGAPPPILLGSELKPDLRQCSFVGVSGVYGSGTHLLLEYLEGFFDERIQPANEETNSVAENPFDGFLCWEEQHGRYLWKHAVPCKPWTVPTEAVVLLTVREPCAWVRSLAWNPYELFSCDGICDEADDQRDLGPYDRVDRKDRKDKPGAVSWLFGPVEIRPEGGGWDPEEAWVDPDTVRVRWAEGVGEMWSSYVGGYRMGRMLPIGGAPLPRYVVVRYEDILLRPSAVVAELEAAGLRRNSRPFAPIERNVRLDANEYLGSSGAVFVGDSRRRLLRRNGARQRYNGLRPWMLDRLCATIACDDLQWLGYAPLLCRGGSGGTAVGTSMQGSSGGSGPEAAPARVVEPEESLKSGYSGWELAD